MLKNLQEYKTCVCDDMLIGNEHITSLASGGAEKLSHAYIFEGAAGSGKKTAALYFACRLNCRQASGDGASEDCRNCSRIVAGITPDVAFIVPEEKKRAVSVAQIRELRNVAYFRSNELDFKAFIITGADLMQNSAQNALLKLLEEPPENVYIFLLCENVSGLLETIVSRAPVLKMRRLTDGKIENHLIKTNKKAADFAKKNKESFDEAVRLSGGLLGVAAANLNQRSSGAAAAYAQAVSLLDIICHGSRSELVYAMSVCAAKREELSELFMQMITALRDVLAAKRGIIGMKLFFPDDETVQKYTNSLPAFNIIKIIECFDRARAELEMNVNLKTELVKLASEISEYK